MKVVVICSYFPPDNSVGIRRVLSLVKFLAENDCEVTVITPFRQGVDQNLLEISKFCNIIHSSFFRVRSFNEEQVSETDVLSKSKKSVFFLAAVYFKRRILNRFIGQLADPFLISYIGAFFSKKLMSTFKNSVVISSSPSWSSHFLAARWSKKVNMSLILDYRDPFYGCHQFTSKFSYFEKILDKYLCSSADYVTTVSPSWVESYSTMAENVKLIRNGYDRSKDSPITINGITKINYIGSILHEDRIPISLISALNTCDKRINLNIVGTCMFQDAIEKIDTKGLVTFRGNISHADAFKEMISEGSINFIQETKQDSDLFSRGIIPTKVYEYIGAGRPIISSIAIKSDALALLQQSGLLVKNAITAEEYSSLLDKIVSEGLSISPNVNFIKSLDRKESNKQMLSLVKNLKNRLGKN